MEVQRNEVTFLSAVLAFAQTLAAMYNSSRLGRPHQSLPTPTTMIPGLPKNILGDRLASSRGRGRGFGRGRGGAQQPVDQDKIIQGTDGDALGSRISAVNAGYLTDQYIVHFYSGEKERPTRYPIINRGMSLVQIFSVHSADALQAHMQGLRQ